MNVRFLLDTNIVSIVLRKASPIDQELARLAPGEWCISAVTRAELRYGVARNPGRKLALAVESFLDMCWTAPWDQSAADCHGRLRAQLHAEGNPIGHFDEMLGAHALALNCTMVTDNVKHFQRISGLSVVNWLR